MERQLQLTSEGLLPTSLLTHLLTYPLTYLLTYSPTHLLQYGEAGPTTAPKHGEKKAAVWAHIQAVLARGGSVEGSA